MRTITARQISDTVAELCIRANKELPEDIIRAMQAAREKEPWPLAQSTLDVLRENIQAAAERDLPVCQDTGLACVFVRLGQDVHIEGDFNDAVNEGVRRGYAEGYLRKSVVSDPLRRVNTGDNSPAAITVELVPGDKLKLTVIPKGFGSENMSRLAMLKPADGLEGVKRFVVETVKAAGSNPCPPIVVGVGIGGTFEKCAQLSKFALMRELDSHHPLPEYRDMEQELLAAINRMDIGPAGLGGHTSALAVHIETFPTHIAGLPVAVNICCHAYRHSTVTL